MESAWYTRLSTRRPARRLARVAAVAAVLVAPALFTTPAGATPPGAEYAVNVQTLIRGGSGGTFPREAWSAFLGNVGRAGVHAVRFEALWNWAEPSRPQGSTHSYDWTKQDDAVIAFARAGMRWKALLSFIPGWAHGPNGVGFPAQYHDDFAAFAAAVVRRYGPGGSFWAAHPEIPPLPIAEYEVWSEPNSSNYWQPTQDSAEYWRVYQQIRTAIKDADAGAQVLVSLGWQEAVPYLGGMRAAAGDAWAIDGVAFHPYAPTPSGIVTLVQKMRTALRAAGSPDVPIHVWEIGWPRTPHGPGVLHSWDPGRISDEVRASHMTLASDALLRSNCGVADVAPYSLVEKEVDPNNWEQWFGLYNQNGSPTQTMLAWATSIARFRAESPRLGLDLCSPDPDAASSGGLLPLGFAATVTSPGCVKARVTYDGLPVEQALIAYRTDRGPEGDRATDTTGTVAICVPERNRQANFDLTASLPPIAAGPALRCSPRACHVVVRAARRCTTPRVVAPAGVKRPTGPLRITVGLVCGKRALAGRRLRVYGMSMAGTRRVLRTVRTRSRNIRIVVRLDRRYAHSLLVSFQGVRALGLAPASRRVSLR